MLFYKIEGSLVKIDAENEDSRKAHRANVRRIAIKSDEFNEKFCRDSFFFVSNSSDGILTVGVIAERQGKIRETLKAYLKHIECELADIVVTEITFNSIQNLLCSADRQDYIADDDEVMEKYGLDKISGRRGRSIDFGENIIEERSEDVVVIFAGYPDEMENFLQKNPGLRSRIAFHVPFEDYDADELCKIASLIGKNKGISLEDAALQKLGTIFETARKQSDFGNGRYVRNVLEQAKMNQASRLLKYDFEDITTEEITTIKAVDIVIPEEKIEEKRKIGFAC